MATDTSPSSTDSSKTTPKSTNYANYWQAEFNRPTSFPVEQKLPPELYRPTGEWMGRLILPERSERDAVMGTLMELYHADEAHLSLVGSTVRLRWKEDVETNSRFWGVTQPVFFDDDARKVGATGHIVPERLDQRGPVNPFESLAGAHPNDDILVRLHGPVTVDDSPEDGGLPIVYTPAIPVQITGRAYTLVRFVAPAEGDLYRVVHFNSQTGTFDGVEEVVRLPEVVRDSNEIPPSTRTGIENSPCNEMGWYAFGTQEASGTFCIQALGPRALVRCQPDETFVGAEASKAYLKPAGWRKVGTKGTVHTALLCPEGANATNCLEEWREGDFLLLVHLYGGIGGPKGEPEARSPLYWGHFAFGSAHIIREPLANELIFDIEYYQVYVHNPDGLTSGTLHWSRYAVDRQYGWMGVRPIQDVLIKLDCYTDDLVIGDFRRSGLKQTVMALEVMCARYRIADGRGGTRISAANNCAQDSSQALYAAIRQIERALNLRSDVKAWGATHPEQAERMRRLVELGDKLRHTLLPFGSARADWEWGMATLGSSLATSPLESMGMALRSWRTMLPSVAVRAVVQVFLDQGASAWVLRSNQVGGDNPGIEPRIPSV